MDKRTAFLAALTTAALLAGSARAGTISLNFVGGGPNGGASLAPSAVAGHPAVEAANWNNAAGISGAGLALVDSQGLATGATATWTAPNVWALPGAYSSSGSSTMMHGYLDNNSTVTITGVPYQYYNVWVYFDGDNGGAWRAGQYAIGAKSFTSEDSENRNFETNGHTNGGGAPPAGSPGGFFQVPVPGGAANAPYSTRLNVGSTTGNNTEGNVGVLYSLSGSSFTLTASVVQTVAPLSGIQIVEDATTGFGVNFIGGQNAGDTSGNVTSFAGAGKYGQANWNNVAANSNPNGSVAAGSLLDRQGNPLAATTVAWTSPNTWASGIGADSQNHALMRGYLDDGGTGATVTVNSVGLPQYDVVVYVDGDQGAAGANGRFWLQDTSGNRISNRVFVHEGTSGTDHFSGVFQQGRAADNSTTTADMGNYLVFQGVTASDFVLRSDNDAGGRAPLNAFQVFKTDRKSIGVNIVGGAAPMLTEEIAGLYSQSHWNNVASAATGTAANLMDSQGAATTADVAWSTPNVWQNNTGADAGDRRMMAGYLDNFHSGGALSVSDIPWVQWDLIVYTESDRSGSPVSQYVLNVGGQTLTASTTDAGGFDGILDEGLDYVVFRGVYGHGFTLTAIQQSGAAAAPINGLQLVLVTAVPEPSAAVLLGLSGLGAVVLAGRRLRCGGRASHAPAP